MTLGYTDCEDLFAERFIGPPANGPGSMAARYEHGGELKEAVRRVELITVKKQAEPVAIEVVSTVHGPVVTSIGMDHQKEYTASSGFVAGKEEREEAAIEAIYALLLDDQDATRTFELSFCATGLAPRLHAIEALYELLRAEVKDSSISMKRKALQLCQRIF